MTSTNNERNIAVVVRLRPELRDQASFLAGGAAARGGTGVEDGGQRFIWMATESGDVASTLPRAQITKRFYPDDVFGPSDTQADIYERSVKRLVLAVPNGVNASVLAYGQTGSGKTHTMVGEPACPVNQGIVPRAFTDLFKALTSMAETEGWQWSVKLSIMEVYQEQLHDLLAPAASPDDSMRTRPRLRLIGEEVILDDVCQAEVQDAPSALALLEQGFGTRRVGSTAMNAHSSRSHAIVSLYVHGTRTCPPSSSSSSAAAAASTLVERRAVLDIIDLAGSEQQKKTLADGERLKEATAINVSLSALSSVVTSLSIAAKSAQGAGAAERPRWRDSKLTMLLKRSLGGNCLTAIIATLSPALEHWGESQSTLDFVTRARQLKTRPVQNQTEAVAAVHGGAAGAVAPAPTTFQETIRRLTLANAELRSQLAGAASSSALPTATYTTASSEQLLQGCLSLLAARLERLVREAPARIPPGMVHPTATILAAARSMLGPGGASNGSAVVQDVISQLMSQNTALQSELCAAQQWQPIAEAAELQLSALQAQCYNMEAVLLTGGGLPAPAASFLMLSEEDALVEGSAAVAPCGELEDGAAPPCSHKRARPAGLFGESGEGGLEEEGMGADGCDTGAPPPPLQSQGTAAASVTHASKRPRTSLTGGAPASSSASHRHGVAVTPANAPSAAGVTVPMSGGAGAAFAVYDSQCDIVVEEEGIGEHGATTDALSSEELDTAEACHLPNGAALSAITPKIATPLLRRRVAGVVIARESRGLGTRGPSLAFVVPAHPFVAGSGTNGAAPVAATAVAVPPSADAETIIPSPRSLPLRTSTAACTAPPQQSSNETALALPSPAAAGGGPAALQGSAFHSAPLPPRIGELVRGAREEAALAARIHASRQVAAARQETASSFSSSLAAMNAFAVAVETDNVGLGGRVEELCAALEASQAAAQAARLAACSLLADVEEMRLPKALRDAAAAIMAADATNAASVASREATVELLCAAEARITELLLQAAHAPDSPQAGVSAAVQKGLGREATRPDALGSAPGVTAPLLGEGAPALQLASGSALPAPAPQYSAPPPPTDLRSASLDELLAMSSQIMAGLPQGLLAGQRAAAAVPITFNPAPTARSSFVPVPSAAAPTAPVSTIPPAAMPPARVTRGARAPVLGADNLVIGGEQAEEEEDGSGSLFSAYSPPGGHGAGAGTLSKGVAAAPSSASRHISGASSPRPASQLRPQTEKAARLVVPHHQFAQRPSMDPAMVLDDRGRSPLPHAEEPLSAYDAAAAVVAAEIAAAAAPTAVAAPKRSLNPAFSNAFSKFHQEQEVVVIPASDGARVVAAPTAARPPAAVLLTYSAPRPVPLRRATSVPVSGTQLMFGGIASVAASATAAALEPPSPRGLPAPTAAPAAAAQAPRHSTAAGAFPRGAAPSLPPTHEAPSRAPPPPHSSANFSLRRFGSFSSLSSTGPSSSGTGAPSSFRLAAPSLALHQPALPAAPAALSTGLEGCACSRVATTPGREGASALGGITARACDSATGAQASLTPMMQPGSSSAPSSVGTPASPAPRLQQPPALSIPPNATRASIAAAAPSVPMAAIRSPLRSLSTSHHQSVAAPTSAVKVAQAPTHGPEAHSRGGVAEGALAVACGVEQLEGAAVGGAPVHPSVRPAKNAMFVKALFGAR